MVYVKGLLLSTDSYADAERLFNIAAQSAETSFTSITESLVPGIMTVFIGFHGTASNLKTFVEENIHQIDGTPSVYH